MPKRRSRRNFLSPQGGIQSGANNVGVSQANITQNQYGQLGFPGTMDSWGMGNESEQSPDLNINNAQFNSRAIPVHPFWVILLRYSETNALFKKIIELPVNDAIKDVNIRAKRGLDDAQLDELNYKLKKLGFYHEFKKTCFNARTFGGGVLFFLNEDQEITKKPLSKNEKGLFLAVADCWQVNRTGEWKTEEIKDKNDKTITIDIPERFFTDNKVFKFFNQEVHPSRAVIIKNKIPANFWADITRGWGISEYDSVGAPLSQWDRYWDMVFKLLEVANIDVVTVDDLQGAFSNPQMQAQTLQKLRIMSEAKNVYRTMITQRNDSLDRKQIDLGGIFQGAEPLANQLCGCAGIPKRYLFGEDPKGLNNGGEGTMEIYGSKIASLREDLTPSLIQALEKFAFAFCGLEIENLDIEFSTLRQPNYQEDLAMKTWQVTTLKEHLDSGLIDENQFANAMNKIEVLPIEYVPKKLEDFDDEIEEDEEFESK